MICLRLHHRIEVAARPHASRSQVCIDLTKVLSRYISRPLSIAQHGFVDFKHEMGYQDNKTQTFQQWKATRHSPNSPTLNTYNINNIIILWVQNVVIIRTVRASFGRILYRSILKTLCQCKALKIVCQLIKLKKMYFTK